MFGLSRLPLVCKAFLIFHRGNQAKHCTLVPRAAWMATGQRYLQVTGVINPLLHGNKEKLQCLCVYVCVCTCTCVCVCVCVCACVRALSTFRS